MTFSLTTWCSGSSTVRKLFNWWIQRSSSCRELPNPNSCPPHHLFCLLHSTCFHLPWPWQMLPHLQEIRAKTVILSMSSVCRGNQAEEYKDKCVLPTSMGVGVSWSGAAWVLPALGSYSSLRESWMPTCTVTYWSRAWSPPFGDWAAGQYSNMIMTPNTPPRRPLPC